MAVIPVVGAAILICAAVWGAAAFSEQHRARSLQSAEREVEKLATAAEAVVNRQMLQVDGALASVQQLLSLSSNARLSEFDEEGAARGLRLLSFQAFAFRDLFLVEQHGRIRAAARRLPTNRLFPADAEAVLRLSAASAGAIVGPQRNPATGDWVVYVVRRSKVVGLAEAYVAAEVPTALITTPLSTFADRAGVVVMLERGNGTLLAQLPQRDDAVGRMSTEVLGLERSGGEANASEANRDPPPITAVKTTLYSDLVVRVSLDRDAALADWKRDRTHLAWVVSGGCIVLTLLAGLVSFGMHREVRLGAQSRRARAMLEEAIDAMSDGFVMWDGQDRLVTCNATYRDLYRLSAPFIVPGALLADVMRGGARAGQYPQAGDDIERFVDEAIAWRQSAKGSFERLLPDGRWLQVTERKTASGGYVGIRTDITAFKKALNELADANRKVGTMLQERETRTKLFNAALNNMTQGLLMVDAGGHIIVANGRFRELFDIDYALDLESMTLRDVFGTVKASRGSFATTADTIVDWQLAVARTHGLDEQVIEGEKDRALKVMQRQMPAGGFVATYEDVTDRQRAEKRIRYLAHHDPLTKLQNRTVFRNELEAALLAERPAGVGVALLYLDLDRFKEVNDTLGHPVGDALLVAVAARLQNCIRRGDAIARLGGDEFAVVLTAPSVLQMAQTLATRFIGVICEEFSVEGHRISVGASVGVAVAEVHDIDPDLLLKQADLALYEAKAQGRNRVCVFQSAMAEKLEERLRLEDDLRSGLEHGEFDIDYQPIFALGSGRVSGYEALIRWNHPVRGRISPTTFVPLAEGNGLINDIGAWCLGRACADMAAFPDAPRIAVNVSPVQLKSETLTDAVSEALARSGTPPGRLELEITETALLDEDPRIERNLFALRALGVRIALDDFGVGFSSLSHIRRFPFDKIKIDKVFIREATEKKDSLAIVRSIVNLAQQLSMTTTAEGIETEAQLRLVEELGCTEGQGYLLGRPASVTANLLRTVEGQCQRTIGLSLGHEPIAMRT
ncbi:MAG: EAL domain-containing protein [Phreatobacter sp.]|nr:EAL domain-containing protein [Phreatobacter sp.]